MDCSIIASGFSSFTSKEQSSCYRHFQFTPGIAASHQRVAVSAAGEAIRSPIMTEPVLKLTAKMRPIGIQNPR